jgi:hypothetical protein
MRVYEDIGVGDVGYVDDLGKSFLRKVTKAIRSVSPIHKLLSKSPLHKAISKVFKKKKKGQPSYGATPAPAPTSWTVSGTDADGVPFSEYYPDQATATAAANDAINGGATGVQVTPPPIPAAPGAAPTPQAPINYTPPASYPGAASSAPVDYGGGGASYGGGGGGGAAYGQPQMPGDEGAMAPGGGEEGGPEEVEPGEGGEGDEGEEGGDEGDDEFDDEGPKKPGASAGGPGGKRGAKQMGPPQPTQVFAAGEAGGGIPMWQWAVGGAALIGIGAFVYYKYVAKKK